MNAHSSSQPGALQPPVSGRGGPHPGTTGSVLTYRQARVVVLGFGAALISGVAVAAFYRGADVVEVGAILLFLPVLVGLTLGDVTGGLVTALVASAIYVAVRLATLGDLPPGEFVGTVVIRVALYVGLGVFGGWANGMLAGALKKLELYDGIDDDTGVGNARAFVSTMRRERSRADRYGQAFTVVVISLDGDTLSDHGGHTRDGGTRLLRRLCMQLESNVRLSDLVYRIPVGDTDDVAIFLAGTGHSAAAIACERFVDAARGVLAEVGAGSAVVETRVMTYPNDSEALVAYEERVATGAAADHLDIELDTRQGAA